MNPNDKLILREVLTAKDFLEFARASLRKAHATTNNGIDKMVFAEQIIAINKIKGRIESYTEEIRSPEVA